MGGDIAPQSQPLLCGALAGPLPGTVSSLTVRAGLSLGSLCLESWRDFSKQHHQNQNRGPTWLLRSGVFPTPQAANPSSLHHHPPPPTPHPPPAPPPPALSTPVGVKKIPGIQCPGAADLLAGCPGNVTSLRWSLSLSVTWGLNPELQRPLPVCSFVVSLLLTSCVISRALYRGSAGSPRS